MSTTPIVLNYPSRAVTITDPLSGFGEVMTSSLHARVQIMADYGLLATDVIATSASNGTATATAGMFVCQTGTTVGGYGVIRSRRLVRYRPGQACRFRWTALYTSPVALSQQLSGAFSATEGLFFGYVGVEFGVMRRIAGATAIHRLTVSTGSGGVETLTLTLAGVAFVFATSGALSTTALAEFIAEQTSTALTGWATSAPQSVGATVTFLQDVPAVTAGAFTLTSSGTAAGTFATVQAGAANVTTGATCWIPQTAWNIDRLDGSLGEYNPSRVTLDPTKLNVFEVIMPYLGAGSIDYRVMLPSAQMLTVHRIEYPNGATIPALRQPTLRLGWVAASLGSTTNLVVKGASAAGFREGESQVAIRDQWSRGNTGITATTADYVLIAFRVRSELGSTTNQREMWPHTLNVTNETVAKNLTVRVWVNPTITGTVNWTRHSAESAVDYATPTAITPSGEIVAQFTIAGSAAYDFEWHEHEARFEPGDVIVISGFVGSATAAVDLSLIWHEL